MSVPMYCDDCDGCGWREGGPTLQAKCPKCGGTGLVQSEVLAPPPPGKPSVEKSK